MTADASRRRTIVFGDVHGCHEEWRDLLDAIGPATGDRLVSVGDLVNKGPSSEATLELARSLSDFRVVVGNHERSHLRRWHANGRRADERSRAEFGPAADDWLAWIDTWPAFLDDDDPDCIVVHAGLRPGIPLAEQSIDDLTRLRELPDGRPWHAAWAGPRLVVYGHWAMQGLHVTDTTIGLDSGCVYGGRLSAVVLPERRIASVPARRQYVDPLAP